VRSYDPTEVSTTFSGQPIAGYATDTFIECVRDEDAWTLTVGNSGDGARSRNPVKSGTITITLLAHSPSNALLQAIADADELSGEGVGEFMVKDRSTLTALCLARSAWIQKPPDWTRAKELGTVTWVLRTDELTIKHDGLIDVTG
jgi:hypothetical protein